MRAVHIVDYQFPPIIFLGRNDHVTELTCLRAILRKLAVILYSSGLIPSGDTAIHPGSIVHYLTTGGNL
jgi:hypothetical protein